MNHLEKKLSAQKEESSMKQNCDDKTVKTKAEVKQKSEEVLKWIITISYCIILIYFVFKPLTEFMWMVEYNIKIAILNYFIK